MEKKKTKKTKPIPLTILLVTALLTTTLVTFPITPAAAAALPYTETNGVLNGANYTIRIPNPTDNWNGMLVMLCRGYQPSVDLTTGAPTVLPAALQSTGGLSSIAPSLIAQGYAIAASNYGAVGMSIQKGINTTYDLTQYVIRNFNVKGKVFLIGQSMGGDIALLLGQKYPKVYSGVLDESGVKNLTETYVVGSAMAATQNDSALIAMLQSFNDVVVPYPISALVSSLPLSVQLQVWRSFSRQGSLDIANETGGTPAAVPQAYAAESPVMNANISIPVITIHGTRDGLVAYSQSLDYQRAVAAAGKSSLYRLVTLDGAEHVDAQVIAQTIPRLNELVAWSNAQDAWITTVTDRSLKAYPDLKETVWQKNATMPPNGPYDKIGLHRLVKTGITPKGVVFLTNCATWGMGEVRISNPATDTFTKYANFSQAIYWANRGFDVYAIDYRSHFAPQNLTGNQTSFAANWGIDVWISDTKEAAEKVKQVSGSSKFFISGECTGGMVALDYATLYWKTDLQGIILLDANFYAQGYPIIGKFTGTNSFNLTAVINDMNAKSNWTYSPYAGLIQSAGYALQNPGAPAEYPPGTPLTPTINPLTNKTWTNITEWFNYALQYNFGTVAATTPAGMYSNPMGGYGNLTQDEYILSKTEFLPWRFIVESQAINDWTNCPYVSFDYNDHYSEIGVPVLAFDTIFSNRTGTLRFANGISSTDLTGVYLTNYGHLDLYAGTYSARDVSEPAYQWMLSHLSTLDVTAGSSATVWPGWTWWFYVQNLGGNAPYSYQWYEGLNPIQGQTQMVLPVSKTAPGVYSFYCRVTDKDGTTTTSNAVTLTVLG